MDLPDLIDALVTDPLGLPGGGTGVTDALLSCCCCCCVYCNAISDSSAIDSFTAELGFDILYALDI